MILHSDDTSLLRCSISDNVLCSQNGHKWCK